MEKQNSKVLFIGILVIALVFLGLVLYINKLPKLEVDPNTLGAIGEINKLRTAGATHSSSSIESSGLSIVLEDNGERKYAAMCNEGSNGVYLQLATGTAVVNQGIFLASSGGCYEILPENMYQGRITGITQTGTSSVTTVEFR